MYCPFCKVQDTKVIDSRITEDGEQVRRRRECIVCNERFTTYEIVELTLPRVIKRDERRSAFDIEKIRAGMLKGLEKRPVSTEQVDSAIQRIIHRIRALGEREIHSYYIGELVMNELREMDPVAYVRFASVYRSFQDIQAFHDEIKRLQEQT